MPRTSRSTDLRSTVLLVSVLLVSVLSAGRAVATTYVPVSDQALVDRAAVIGTFEVVSSSLAPTARLTTEYLVRVETLLKGDLSGATALVRVPGGRSPGETSLRFSGLPTFAPGERGVLLFLVPRHDGTWGIAHLLLGAFRELERREGDLLVRPHLTEAHSIGRDGREATGDGSTARDRERFLQWISDRAAGRSRRADYLVSIDPVALAPRFTQFHANRTGLPMRWFDFDGGGNVPWYSADQGPEGYPDGGVEAVQAGLAAWSNLTEAAIRLHYAGQRPVDGGFQGFDFVNEILFEDPNQDIDEEFDCSEGGVLAIGGPFFDDEKVFRYRNQNWHPIEEGAVVVNANTRCYFIRSNLRMGEVVAHELGHTLGFRHSCGDDNSPPCAGNPVLDDALMRASVHNDGRGARLGADDMAAGRALYGTVTAGPSTPRAPNNLKAVLTGNDVKLTWNDRSNDEQGFRVYRRLGNGSFAAIGETGPGQASLNDMDLGNGSWSYEVRAFNPSGDSPPSNRVTVVLEELGTPGVARLAAGEFYGSEGGAAVIELVRVGGAGGPLSVRLRTRDLSATAGLDYVARDLTVTWVNQDDAPKLINLSIVDDFETEASELVEVLLETVPAAGQSQGVPLGVATVAIADDDGSPGCAQNDRDLCLLGGRFKVEVEWRNQRNAERGVGHALAGSDQSGYFWFFNQENVELIVKALDGRPLTGAHWLFYGGLSDVEYWIIVTDTATGSVKLYRNAPGSICGLGDTGAFPQALSASTPSAAGVASPTAPRSSAAVAAPGFAFDAAPALTPRAQCVPGPLVLCILGGRFQVEVTWRNHRNGDVGVGTAIPFSDQSGFFWFFDDANIELVVKALDGSDLNGKFWFFYGALSDVEYTIKVTDTVTTQVHSYNNAGGNICGQGDINAFPGDP